jgi:hypothetical protein
MCHHTPKCVDRQSHIKKLEREYWQAPINDIDANTISRADIGFVIRFEKDQLQKELTTGV